MSPEYAPVMVLGPGASREPRTEIVTAHGPSINRQRRPGLTVPSRVPVVVSVKVTDPDGVTTIPGDTVAVIFTDPSVATVPSEAVSPVCVVIGGGGGGGDTPDFLAKATGATPPAAISRDPVITASLAVRRVA